MELDFSERIKYMECYACETEGSEEVITMEAWAEEKNKGKALNKPFRTSGGPKKFSVYVKNDKGNVVKVNFGDPNMSIKRDNPERKKSFRARHNCSNPGPKWKARYWSCRMWSGKSVNKITKGSDMTDEEVLIFLDESEAELTEKQKKLPPAVQKRILKNQNKNKKPGDKNTSNKKPEEKAEKSEESEAKRGLWDNIRDKKRRMGKNYKPAKPGDKDRPDPDSWKKAQKKKKDSKAKISKDGEYSGKPPSTAGYKPQKMYDKQGKAYEAKTKADYDKMKKKGYTESNQSKSSK